MSKFRSPSSSSPLPPVPPKVAGRFFQAVARFLFSLPRAFRMLAAACLSLLLATAGILAVYIALLPGKEPEKSSTAAFISTEEENAETLDPLNAQLFALAQSAKPDLKALGALLRQGVTVDCRNSRGDTLLLHAVRHGAHAGLVLLLLDSGWPVDQRNPRGDTALHYAAANRDAQVISLLLQAGAEPTAENSSGRTALELAAANSGPEGLALLLDAQNELSPERENDLLFLSVINPDLGVPGYFLNAGGNVSARSKSGATLLMAAAHGNPNPEVVPMLLLSGLAVNATDNQGCTPLHYAAKNNPEPRILLALLKAGADINAIDAEGRTPLMLAAGYNPAPECIIELLAAKGADLHLVSRDGRKAVNWALENDLPQARTTIRILELTQQTP